MSSAPRRLFIITGDPSGDMHAAKLVASLRVLDPTIEVAAVGGTALQQAGVPLISDQTRMGQVGFGAFFGAWYHYRLGRRILKYLDTFRPDAVLHIDYGVFNLWMAGQLRKRGIRTLYFIPPQVWASRRGRIRKIKANVDHVFCIFPFEEPLYREHGIPVTYVGHPLVGELPSPADRVAFCRRHGLDPAKPIVGLFPGSRKMEINYLLSPIVQAIPHIKAYQPDAQFAIAKSSALDKRFYEDRLRKAVRSTDPVPCVHTVENENHALMSVADVLIVKSGTGTLEAALYGKPMVIVYKGHPLAYHIAMRLCYLPCIGLPNVLTDVHDPIVPELLQDVTPQRLADALAPMFDPHSADCQKALNGYARIRETLSRGHASDNLAREILRLIAPQSAVSSMV